MLEVNSMKNVILLIFTPDDLAFLPEAVKRLRAMALDYLWILHTPQLGLPYPASAAALDQEIESCERDKQRASLSDNFDDAAKYRDQANGLRVKRELEIKNAYKAIPHEQILAVYDRTFAPLNEETTGIPNIIREALPDPISADGALSYLASRGTDWFDQFPHGEYAILWIRALPELAVIHPAGSFGELAAKESARLSHDVARAVGDFVGAVPPVADRSTENVLLSNRAERDRLMTIPYTDLKSAADEAGVSWGRKKREVIVDEILAAQELATV